MSMKTLTLQELLDIKENLEVLRKLISLPSRLDKIEYLLFRIEDVINYE